MSLERIYNPRSVAIVDASQTKGKLGTEFGGEVYSIKYDLIKNEK